jgi:glycosyltransferase involved in cell wall biosynthesis
VPARFLVEVCEKYTADLGTPVYYCPLGVDVETFTPPARKREPRAEGVFRWLWCGAPNARKGWDAVRALIPAFDAWGRMEICFKTTGPAGSGPELIQRRCRGGLTVVCDARNLSRAEMASLYQGSHAFLYPTRGEGFGLTLAEAMAAGLPCLYTPWSACTDLADASCAFPLRYRLERLELAPNLPETDPRHERFRVTAAVPRVDLAHMADEMVRVMARYRAARERGLRAAERIREHFTWSNTGARLRAILEKEAARCPQAVT